MKRGRGSGKIKGRNEFGAKGDMQELSAQELRRRARAVLLYYEEVHGILTDQTALPDDNGNKTKRRKKRTLQSKNDM